MAYFGGTVSQKPWPRYDFRFILLLLLSVAGIMCSIFLARDVVLPKVQPATENLGAAQMNPAILSVVLMATQEIPAGTKISAKMFRFETQSIQGLENQVVTDADEAIGGYARANISANTPILKAAISKGNNPNEITTRIPPGYRAVAIPVNLLTGVEGWVRPGASVDVVWSTEQGKKPIVVTIVENAQVLSVERSLEAEVQEHDAKTIPNHITLLVTTADAQKIQLAKGTGSLNLSLRGSEDNNAVGSITLTSDALLDKRNAFRGDLAKVKINGEEFVFLDRQLVPLKKYQESLKQPLN